MRKLENLFGQRADSFFCVYPVPQPSVWDLVVTAGGVLSQKLSELGANGHLSLHSFIRKMLNGYEVLPD